MKLNRQTINSTYQEIRASLENVKNNIATIRPSKKTLSIMTLTGFILLPPLMQGAQNDIPPNNNKSQEDRIKKEISIQEQKELTELKSLEETFSLVDSNGKVNACFSWPVSEGMPGSTYGRRMHPIYHVWKFHDGVDIKPISKQRGNNKSYIIAPKEGIVEFVGRRSGDGKMIKLNHSDLDLTIDNKITTSYSHLSQYLVQRGDTVHTGDTIAIMGSTGASTGKHLHYSMNINGKSVNPANYLTEDIQKQYYKDDKKTKEDRTAVIKHENNKYNRMLSLQNKYQNRNQNIAYAKR